MNDKGKDPENGAFLNLEYPGLRFNNAIVHKLEHIIIGGLILFPERNQIGRHQVIIILIIRIIPEDLGIIHIHNSLILMHDMKHLTRGYFLIVEEVLEVLFEDDVID